MVTDLTRNWWILAIRGVFGILFGIGAFVWPEATLAALVLLFGIYSLLDGIFAIATSISIRQNHSYWWLLLLEGVAGVIIGIIALLLPGVTALMLLYLIASWAIITGIFEIAAAVRLRKEIDNEFMLIITGIASIVFGILMIAFPGLGALSMIWMIGAYAIVFGFLTLLLAFRLRKVVTQPT